MPRPGSRPARSTLRRLGRIVRSLAERADSRRPLEDLLALAGLPPEAGITIDFTSTRELGHPLVILRDPVSDAAPKSLLALSAREREVAALAAEGLSNKEMAARLDLSLGTVKDHMHHIFVKTGLPNRTALAAALLSAPSYGLGSGAVNPSLDGGGPAARRGGAPS